MTPAGSAGTAGRDYRKDHDMRTHAPVHGNPDHDPDTTLEFRTVDVDVAEVLDLLEIAHDGRARLSMAQWRVVGAVVGSLAEARGARNRPVSPVERLEGVQGCADVPPPRTGTAEGRTEVAA